MLSPPASVALAVAAHGVAAAVEAAGDARLDRLADTVAAAAIDRAGDARLAEGAGAVATRRRHLGLGVGLHAVAWAVVAERVGRAVGLGQRVARVAGIAAIGRVATALRVLDTARCREQRQRESDSTHARMVGEGAYGCNRALFA